MLKNRHHSVRDTLRAICFTRPFLAHWHRLFPTVCKPIAVARNALRDRLIDLRMLVEATLDFPEEEIDFLEKANARGRLVAIAGQVDAELLRQQARQQVVV